MMRRLMDRLEDSMAGDIIGALALVVILVGLVWIAGGMA
jgi:hypothetical protein